MNSHEILRRKLTLILMKANDPYFNLRAKVVLSSVQFSCLVMSNSLWPHGLHRTRPPCHQLLDFTQTQVHWVGDAIQPFSSSVISFFSHLQSFPALGSFQISQLFASGGQSIGVSASASVLSMNTQDCINLALRICELVIIENRGDGQGTLACWGPCSHKESDTTE